MIRNTFTLKELRARKNKTQQEVARDLGISTQTYNAWEKSIKNVGISKVLALAKYFECSIGDIFFDHEHENNSSN